MKNSNKYIKFLIIDNGNIEYSDSGPGIHPDIESKLFRPFESMKENGRGLGLYIIQELMNMMDADVYLSNERRNNRLFKFVLKFKNILEV
jgi:nitrogen-specific signal transduction histidine kinase